MSFPTNPLYNVSSFDGTIKSDYLRFAAIPEGEKASFIDYSITDFDSYKASLLDYMKAVYPDQFTNFAESDMGIMFVELFAYLASVISLKADFLANESYLPTVRSESNLKKLLQLIGVNLKGPTSAKAEAVVTLSSDFFTALSDAYYAVKIAKADRTLRVPGKDGKNATFTLYKGNSDGTLTFDTSSVGDLQFNAKLNNFVYSNFYLIEGELIEEDFTFSTSDEESKHVLGQFPVVEGSIQVSSADSNLWKETGSLFLASATEYVFEKEYSDDYKATVKFGNGTKGKRPTPGLAAKVFYRIGGGERGNITRKVVNNTVLATKTKPGTLATISVFNNTTATGGTNSESALHAKKYYPHVFKSQHRCVTGEDYTAQANSFTSTAGVMGKAMAVLRDNGAGANNIDIYCLAKASALQLERCSLLYKEELLNHMNNLKMMTDELTIVDGVIRTLDLNCTVLIDADEKTRENAIKQRAADALTSYFHVDRREFGEALSISRLQNFMHDVPGVRYFTVDNFPGDIHVNFNEIVQLNNFELTIDLI